MSRFALALLFVSSLALPLGGCASVSDFTIDPTEWLSGDWFGNKKKLPGERKPVFPEGVPGVTRGVPPDLIKGYQQTDDDRGLADQNALVEEKPKAKAPPKAKPKPKVAATPTPPPEDDSRPTPVTVRRQASPQTQQPPADQWPDPATAQRQRSGGPQWPEPPATRGTQSGGVQWPEPPPTR